MSKLTIGEYDVLYDDELSDIILSRKWNIRTSKTGKYAISREKINGKMVYKYMHRLVIGNIPNGMDVDHIDGNSLNNCRRNLRVCTRSENLSNSRSHIGSSSKYVGVSYDSKGKSKNKWRADIRYGGKRYRLKRRLTEYESAIDRDKFIIENDFKFARLNILSR